MPGKWGPKGTPGVFAGYELGERGIWTGNYLVWNLADFKDMNFASDVYAGSIKLAEPNKTKTISLTSADDYTFPLKNLYDKANLTC